jgi:hypothetical protein
MTLQGGPLARETVEVNGAAVEIRSLSRKETLELAKFTGDPDAGEVYIIARATESSEDEVRVFRETTNALEIDNLLDAILKLSGIDQLAARVQAKAKEQANGGPNV